MKVAIYSRKSVFTGKGESIENQIQMCKDHYLRNYPDNSCEFEIYEDEGFSGANTKRPQFQKLLSEINQNKFKALICYRLDRISRNVADFSAILELLQAHNVAFISIKEQFDTSTPIGKAMVYIASVFAQLERDTIAERIKDNMLQLSKTGRWLGGQTPLGFESEKIIYLDAEMKERSMYKLKPIEEEMNLVKQIFNRYMVAGSIHYVLKELLSSNQKGKNGGEFHTLSISDILRNPVYVKSDDSVKMYLESKGIQFCGTPNGCGIMLYNKKIGGKKYNSMDKWIAAVAKHEGIIESNDWLMVQKSMDIASEKRTATNIRLGTSKKALLTGVLKCAKCGAPMRVTYGRLRKDSTKNYYYTCTMKCHSGKTRCDNPNASGPILEKQVINTLINYDKTVLKEKLNTLLQNEKKVNSNDKSYNMNLEINSLEDEISTLMDQLSKTKNKTTQEFLLKKAEELSTKLDELKNSVNDSTALKKNAQNDIDNLNIVIESFDKFSTLCESIKDLSSIDDDVQIALRNLIDRLVSKITYDGVTHDVVIDVWGKKK
ncbi:Site-specific DNA recombinase [Clostridium sp. DSM 8431]|uniref:recombinase family protein n=1 Tax=Clostridium sp. DSM 8431 TaxID=1761781 RepID=UPI0008F06397|nr:recombinase family protein [Clostridium sp. DSM 8431]SFU45146.1 Site-specific DNA recombinase [Clostridium sp. DSM 8431]